MISDRRSAYGQSVSMAGREGHRYPVTIAASLNSSQLGRRTAEITDLSLQGCRISLPATLPVGHIILIALPTLSPLSARIVWSDGLSSGLNFTKRLGGPVLRMMAERHRRIGFIAV